MNRVRVWSITRTRRVGSVTSLVQRRWVRLMAYSGRTNVGQIRIGRRTGTEQGRQAMRVYGVVYMRMVIGRWMRRGSVVIITKTNTVLMESIDWEVKTYSENERKERTYRVERSGRMEENVSKERRRTVRRMSMTGVPPRSGFASKRMRYRQVIESGYVERSRRGVLASVIGSYNYLRIRKRSAFEGTGEEREVKENKEQAIVMGRRRRRRVGRMREPTGRRRRTERCRT